MEGYELVTSDDKKAGTVVATIGDNLVIEHGTLRKSRHALPKTFVHVDDAERVVRATISKEILESGPTVRDGELDERAVAEHYGLAGGFEAPETEGYGDTLHDDPGRSAEQEELRTGVEPAVQERVAVRQELQREGRDVSSESQGRPIIPPDPHR